MIVKGLFDLVYNLLNIVLTPFQIIPDLPTQFNYLLNRFLDFIFDAIGIFIFFTDANFIKVMVPVILVIINMEHIWDGIIWILKKLPFVGIE